MIDAELEKHLSLIVEGVGKGEAGSILKSTLELDRLLNENRNLMEGRLIHFLEGRSYSKALDWIRGGRNQPSGNCQKKNP
jgi:hypothetical protein